MINLTGPLNPNGVEVPLKQAQSGLKFIKSSFTYSLGGSHNNIFCKLTLYDDHLAIRINKTTTKTYQEIQQVSTYAKSGSQPTTLSWTNLPGLLDYNSIRFDFTSGLFNILCNIKEYDDFLAVLRFLYGKGVPLTPAVMGFIAAPPAQTTPPR